MDPGLQNPLHRQLLPGLFLDLCIQVQPVPLVCAPLGLQGLGQSLDVGTGRAFTVQDGVGWGSRTHFSLHGNVSVWSTKESKKSQFH